MIWSGLEFRWVPLWCDDARLLAAFTNHSPLPSQTHSGPPPRPACCFKVASKTASCSQISPRITLLLQKLLQNHFPASKTASKSTSSFKNGFTITSNSLQKRFQTRFQHKQLKSKRLVSRRQSNSPTEQIPAIGRSVALLI